MRLSRKMAKITIPELCGIIDNVILKRSGRSYFVYKPGARERIIAAAELKWETLDAEERVDLLADLLGLEEVSIFPLPESAYAFP